MDEKGHCAHAWGTENTETKWIWRVYPTDARTKAPCAVSQEKDRLCPQWAEGEDDANAK